MMARRVAIVVLLLAALTALALKLPFASWLAGAAAWAGAHREAGGAIFVAAYVLAAVFLVPGAILTVGSGVVFGLTLGVALTSAGSVLGAAAAFGVGRFVAHDWVVRRIATGPRFQALYEATRIDGFMIVLLSRLSPLIPYILLNYALSVTAVRFRDYLLASWIGMLPTTVLYVYTGSLVKNLATLTSAERAPSWAAYSLFAVGFASTVALTVLLTRRATRVLRERLAADAQASLPDGSP